MQIINENTKIIQDREEMAILFLHSRAKKSQKISINTVTCQIFTSKYIVGYAAYIKQWLIESLYYMHLINQNKNEKLFFRILQLATLRKRN